jgi:hypothetical protein
MSDKIHHPSFEEQLEAMLIEKPLMEVVEGLYQIALREEDMARLHKSEAVANKWERASRILNQAVNQLVSERCGDIP